MASMTPEIIPGSDLLLCRVHKNHFNVAENRVLSIVFKNTNQSADWSKYSTPEQTASRHKSPNLIRGVASLTAQSCRDANQDVVHDPKGDEDPDGPNPAHSEIRGEKSLEIKCKLRDAIVSFWENPLCFSPD